MRNIKDPPWSRQSLVPELQSSGMDGDGAGLNAAKNVDEVDLMVKNTFEQTH